MVTTMPKDDIDQIRRWIDEELHRSGKTSALAERSVRPGEPDTVEAFVAQAERFLRTQPDPGAILAQLAATLAYEHPPVAAEAADADPREVEPSAPSVDEPPGA